MNRRIESIFRTAVICPLLLSLTCQSVIAENIETGGSEEVISDISETVESDQNSSAEEMPDDAETSEDSEHEEETDDPGEGNDDTEASSDLQPGVSITEIEKTEAEEETGPAEPAENLPDDINAAEGNQQSGFVTVDGKTYYYDPGTHQPVIGGLALNGDGYWFDNAGVMVTSSWISHGTKRLVILWRRWKTV